MVTPKGEIQRVAREGVLHLTISNPAQRNALTPAMLDALRSCVVAAEEDRSIRLIVLQGAGDTFSSGYSLTAFPKGSDLVEEDELVSATNAVSASSKLVLCVLNGDAIGAAFDIALCADFRIAVSSARVGLTPARFGIVYPWQGVERAVRVLGERVARRLLLTGDLMSAQEAFGSGAIDGVGDAGEPFASLRRSWMAKLERSAPLSVLGLKHVLRLVATGSPSESERNEILRIRRQAIDSSDAVEAARAFREKRPPVFVGR